MATQNSARTTDNNSQGVEYALSAPSNGDALSSKPFNWNS